MDKYIMIVSLIGLYLYLTIRCIQIRKGRYGNDRRAKSRKA